MKFAILITMLTMAMGSYANADGFGVDQIFDSLIASPSLIARTACPELKIAAGERLSLIAQEDVFALQRDADGTYPLVIEVPSDGNYVFEGQSPDRIANEIVSKSKNIKAQMDTNTADILITQLNSRSAPCALNRCPAFGECN